MTLCTWPVIPLRRWMQKWFLGSFKTICCLLGLNTHLRNPKGLLTWQAGSVGLPIIAQKASFNVVWGSWLSEEMFFGGVNYHSWRGGDAIPWSWKLGLGFEGGNRHCYKWEQFSRLGEEIALVIEGKNQLLPENCSESVSGSCPQMLVKAPQLSPETHPKRSCRGCGWNNSHPLGCERMFLVIKLLFSQEIELD